jgi:hypothetical protein
MEEKPNDKEPVVFTMEMMMQLINQLHAVTTYFDLLDVKIKTLQKRIVELENRK